MISNASRAEVSSGHWLVVHREEATQSCPSAQPLEDAVERLLEGLQMGQIPAATVDFSPLVASSQDTEFAAGLRATLRLKDSTSERVLEVSGASCEALGQAAATTLAIMIETHARLATEPTLEAPPAAHTTRPPLAKNSLGVQVRGGAAYAVTHEWAPAFEADVELAHGAFSASLGALYVAPARAVFGPGSVDLELLALASRVCWRGQPAARLVLRGCGGVAGGVLSATATGFTTNAQEGQSWLAVLAEISVGYRVWRSPSLALEPMLAATLVVPTRPLSFSVQGLGTATETAPVGGLFWLGISGLGFW